MLTMLSAFAALAIDAGFLYTKSRNIQAVADAAVRAGMPSMPAGVTAQNAALAIIDANGTFTTRSAVAAGNVLTVEITQVVPSFFGRMLAVGDKTLDRHGRLGNDLGSVDCSVARRSVMARHQAVSRSTGRHSTSTATSRAMVT